MSKDIGKVEIDKFADLDLGQTKEKQGPQLASAQLKQKPNGTGELASIKKAGEREILTPAQFKERARELKKCKKDIMYFCRKYFKIVSLKDGLVTLDPYPKQEELLRFIQHNNRAIVCASRQVGKCQCADSTITIREVSTGWIETVTVGDFFDKYGFSHYDIDDSSGKFVDSVDVDGKYQILTDTVFDDVVAVHKTVQYDVWILTTENHALECADDHIVFDEDWNEVFVKNLNPGQMIWTEDGLEKVIDVVKTDRIENMYDVELPDTTNHRYYTNGILSHNTTIYTVFLLWYAMYHPDKRIMVCGNKLDIAIEIMDRIRLAYEYCPSAIKIGVTTYNKKCIEFENNSIIRCFATGSSGCRGFSANCVSGDTMVTIVDDYDNVYYIPIEQVENIEANSSNMCKYNMMDEGAYMKKKFKHKKYYYVYRIVNMVNNKEYIGFHCTDNLDDGYMGSGNRIVMAIEKYGIENFKKEIIQIFDNQEDAESLERELVNEDYVKRPDTYNISLGGNVCILFGEDNGFYGKKHTEDAKRRMSETKKLYYSTHESKLKEHNFSEEDDVVVNGKTYTSRDQVLRELGIGMSTLNKMLLEPGNGFVNSERQGKHIEFMLELEDQKVINHKLHLEHMLEANQRPERRAKISKALSGRKHDWNDKINKNPEKIRKTAEKHRGMKRSEDAKKHMSDGLKEFYATHEVSNKGKIWIHNPETKEKKYVGRDEPIPSGWVIGMGRRR